MPAEEAIVMVPEDGAASYENWRAALAGAQAGDSWEYPLFSDAELTGEITEGFGPYMVLNALRHELDSQVPVAFLRLQYHLDFPFREMTKTDDQRYHGGFVQDELAALLSLALGFRLVAGPPVRHFQAKGDPKGRPIGFLFGGHIQTQFVPNPL